MEDEQIKIDAKFNELQKYLPLLDDLAYKIENASVEDFPYLHGIQLSKIQSLKRFLKRRNESMTVKNLTTCGELLEKFRLKIDKSHSDNMLNKTSTGEDSIVSQSGTKRSYQSNDICKSLKQRAEELRLKSNLTSQTCMAKNDVNLKKEYLSKSQQSEEAISGGSRRSEGHVLEPKSDFELNTGDFKKLVQIVMETDSEKFKERVRGLNETELVAKCSKEIDQIAKAYFKKKCSVDDFARIVDEAFNRKEIKQNDNREAGLIDGDELFSDDDMSISSQASSVSKISLKETCNSKDVENINPISLPDYDCHDRDDSKTNYERYLRNSQDSEFEKHIRDLKYEGSSKRYKRSHSSSKHSRSRHRSRSNSKTHRRLRSTSSSRHSRSRHSSRSNSKTRRRLRSTSSSRHSRSRHRSRSNSKTRRRLWSTSSSRQSRSRRRLRSSSFSRHSKQISRKRSSRSPLGIDSSSALILRRRSPLRRSRSRHRLRSISPSRRSRSPHRLGSSYTSRHSRRISNQRSSRSPLGVDPLSTLILRRRSPLRRSRSRHRSRSTSGSRRSRIYTQLGSSFTSRHSRRISKKRSSRSPLDIDPLSALVLKISSPLRKSRSRRRSRSTSSSSHSRSYHRLRTSFTSSHSKHISRKRSSRSPLDIDSLSNLILKKKYSKRSRSRRRSRSTSDSSRSRSYHRSGTSSTSRHSKHTSMKRSSKSIAENDDNDDAVDLREILNRNRLRSLKTQILKRKETFETTSLSMNQRISSTTLITVQQTSTSFNDMKIDTSKDCRRTTDSNSLFNNVIKEPQFHSSDKVTSDANMIVDKMLIATKSKDPQINRQETPLTGKELQKKVLEQMQSKQLVEEEERRNKTVDLTPSNQPTTAKTPDAKLLSNYKIPKKLKEPEITEIPISDECKVEQTKNVHKKKKRKRVFVVESDSEEEANQALDETAVEREEPSIAIEEPNEKTKEKPENNPALDVLNLLNNKENVLKLLKNSDLSEKMKKKLELLVSIDSDDEIENKTNDKCSISNVKDVNAKKEELNSQTEEIKRTSSRKQVEVEVGTSKENQKKVTRSSEIEVKVKAKPKSELEKLKEILPDVYVEANEFEDIGVRSCKIKHLIYDQEDSPAVKEPNKIKSDVKVKMKSELEKLKEILPDVYGNEFDVGVRSCKIRHLIYDQEPSPVKKSDVKGKPKNDQEVPLPTKDSQSIKRAKQLYIDKELVIRLVRCDVGTEKTQNTVSKVEKVPTNKLFQPTGLFYFQKKVLKYRCKYCRNYNGVYIARHIIKNHPEEEVYLSRLKEENVEACNAAIEPDTDKSCLPEQSSSDYLCMFCNKILANTTIREASEHVSSLHTGEFDGLIEHDELNGFLCSLCNYTQILKENVQKHTKRWHADKEPSIIEVLLCKKLVKDEPVNCGEIEANEEIESVSEISMPRCEDDMFLATETPLKIEAVDIDEFEVNDQFEVNEDFCSSLKCEETLSQISDLDDSVEFDERPIEPIEKDLTVNIGKISVKIKPSKKVTYCCDIQNCAFKTEYFVIFTMHMQTLHVDELVDGLCSVCGRLEDRTISANVAYKHLIDIHVSHTKKGTVKIMNEDSPILKIKEPVLAPEAPAQIEPEEPQETFEFTKLCIENVVSLNYKETAAECPPIDPERPPTSTEPGMFIETLPENDLDLFVCSHVNCSFSAPNSLNFVSHIQEHDSASSNTIIDNCLQCACCNESFNNPLDLLHHIVGEHANCRFKCGDCHFRAYSYIIAFAHSKIAHPSTEDKLRVVRIKPYNDKRISPKDGIYKGSFQKYRCIQLVGSKVCGSGFYTPSNFIRHVKSKHEDENIGCHFCKEVLLNSSRLVNHVRDMHDVITLYRCGYCDHGADKRILMLHHLMMDHSNRSPVIYSRCKWERSSDANIDEIDFGINTEAHLKDLFGFDVTRPDIDCYSTSAAEKILKGMKMKTMSDGASDVILIPSDGEGNTEKTPLNDTHLSGESLYICVKCRLSFPQSKKFKKHLRICFKNTTELMSCYHCMTVFTTTGNLFKHYRQKHGTDFCHIENNADTGMNEKNSCSSIDGKKRNNTGLALLMSYSILNPDSRFVCGSDRCRFTSSRKSDFANHWEAFHANETQFYCVYCSEYIEPCTEKEKYPWEDHLNLHEKYIFKCMNCSYMDSLHSKMESHCSKNHTKLDFTFVGGDKFEPNDDAWKWQCCICPEILPTLDAMEAHCRRVHERTAKYESDLCDFTSAEDHQMIEHFKSAHPDLKFKYNVAYIRRFIKEFRKKKQKTTPTKKNNSKFIEEKDTTENKDLSEMNLHGELELKESDLYTPSSDRPEVNIHGEIFYKMNSEIEECLKQFLEFQENQNKNNTDNVYSVLEEHSYSAVSKSEVQEAS